MASKRNQCFWCLEIGHRVTDCPSRKKGKEAKQRPDGTYFSPKKANRGEYKPNSPAPESFQAFSFNVGVKPEKTDWLVDTGCNKHLTPFREDIGGLKDSKITCTFGNNEVLKAEGIGYVEMEAQTDKQENVKLILSDVLYVPGLPQRMLSTGQLRRSGGRFTESDIVGSTLMMPDRHTTIPLRKKRDYLWLTVKHKNTYRPVSHARENNTPSSAAVYAPGGRNTASASLIDWHEAMGHPHPASILFLEQRGLIRVNGEKSIDDFNCRICKEAKSTIPHYQRGTRSIKRNGEVAHIDLVGPFSPDMNGCTYLMVFIDEASRYKRSFGLRTKDEAYKRLQTYQDGMLLKGVTVECIRGDGAGELGRSAKFRQALTNLSLKWESSPPYTHQQQGLVERAIRQVVEGGRAQLARAYLGEEYWVWACRDFTFKANYLPHQALGGDSPYERLHPGRKPRYQALRKFGQTAYVHVDKSRQGEFSRGRLNKMRPRSERGVLIGHDMGASAYVVHLPKLKKVVTSSAVVFDDIPTETPFMSGRPEYWMSPAPGIDDADPVIAEETAVETSSDDAQRAQTRNSTFGGRDIPRPPAKVPEEGQEPVSDERKIVRAAADQLETLFANDDPEDGLEINYNLTDGQEISYDESHFVHCMLADIGITVEEAMAG
eukprot:19150_1